MKDCKYCKYSAVTHVFSEEYGKLNLTYCALGEWKSKNTPEGCTCYETDVGKVCCETCKWYAEFEGVCCNADSEWTADFRCLNDTCDCWEENTCK